MAYTLVLGDVSIAVGWDDLFAVALLVSVAAIARNARAARGAAESGRAANETHSDPLGKQDNAPKALRYGDDQSSPSWHATGPGYLPDPDPLHRFDLQSATVRDYVYVNKTLRYPYFQTMSHQPMHINHWIEIDKDYQWYLDEKARVIREQGKHVIDSLPENDDACTELLESLVDYLPKRYPTLFELVTTEKQPYYGILNKVTGERFTDVQSLRGVDALLVVSRLVQDDFLMARERDDGKMYFVGGLIVFPGSYLLSEKINKPLHEVHSSVPHINKMMMSIERTMARFAPDRPFERSSWWIADDRQLFWHNIVSGSVPEDLHPKDLFLRIDHQTFRKLPRTKGIVFGVHPVLQRIGDLANSPLVPALLAKIHTDADSELMDYKKTEKYAARLLPYLQELTQDQIARGVLRAEDVDDVAKFRERAATTAGGDIGGGREETMV
ncbi:hypothetical protein WOLCODRAFT_140094 [Wolfiporia cocos MD-104 SS10]|uniref:Uncharacterized protein n=1 Tax=Wolfiporia cocos (strain MD-104) TaxID=742152 RepID=A0A2H3J1G2_WOLCO|nr:hypothetical protein WOLCODRAFT_140094 [Wolfiporia cocos MD-104 SS10]